jgi:hypothetical protein
MSAPDLIGSIIAIVLMVAIIIPLPIAIWMATRN